MSFIDRTIIHQNLEEKGQYWIAFTGDSLTSAEWVHPNWRDIVVYVLQHEMTKHLNGDWLTAEWGIKGFCFAYSGATTADVLNKVNDITLVHPQLVISLMGSNDPSLGVSVNDSVANIEMMARQIIDTGASLVWCSSTPAGIGSTENQVYEAYARALNSIRKQDDLLIIDMFNLYQGFPMDRFFTFDVDSLDPSVEKQRDLRHPNQLGNAYIAKVILDAVFGISFDPELYIQDTVNGKKLPGY